MKCELQHRYSPEFEGLPNDQSKFNGRHKCAGCAYEKGMESGRLKASSITIDFVKQGLFDTKAFKVLLLEVI